MDKNYAIKLIQDVFQSPFDREQFIAFTKNLFNFLDTERNFIYRGNFIPDAYKPYIHTLERIGKYEDAEDNKIDVLIVHLKKEHSIEHARTMQRNFIAWYLSGSRGGELKDAALVAFHTDNPDDWRFSLVKMDYQIVESETGKIKTKTELTPARRFSFLVGKNENSHTAQKQLLPTLQDDKNNPLLSDFEKAFNIEVVTQEFFERYCGLFLDVKEALEKIIVKNPAISQDFTDKGVDPVDFSKKLLGQIVFLYFLQKKGWFGVGRDDNWGTGPKNFLRLLFEKMIADYKNFFNDILEPLFYEALAKERDKDFYSRFNCKIPFLNGGLFDPISDYDWVHTDILLPDDLFSNHVKTKEGDIGTGILDIFDRYNFTVKEDEPLEKEVAVDPEMLGKVFENLLEVKDRKSKGTYYTPREIVHYMCQESLINYLVNECEGKVNREDIETLIQYGESAVEHDGRVEQEGKETETYSYKLPESVRKNAQLIDDKLKNIRVCDPAIGSGAFPVGMMNEIIRTRNTLTNYLEDKEDRSIYNFKRDAIQNSLYGVDIDPGAVEIAKLRLWLSLVVDEEDIKQIKPLPNLDYKIMQGNSLLEEFEGVRLFDEELISKPSLDDEEQITTLKQRQSDLQREFIKLYSNGGLKGTKKQELELELKKLSDSLKRLNRPEKPKSESGNLFDIFSEAKKKAQELKQLHKEFFEASQKTKKDELKKRIEKLGWELIETTLREQNKMSALKQLEQYKKTNTKPFFLWKLNFAEVFERNGKSGFDVVIGNPPYMKERDNKKVFEIVNNSGFGEEYHQGKMDYWYYFLHKAIDLARDDGLICYITSRYWINSMGAKKLIERVKNELSFVNLVDIGNLRIFENVVGQHMITLYTKSKLAKDFTYKKLENDLSDLAKNVTTDNLHISTLSNEEVFNDSQIVLDNDSLNYKDVIALGEISEVIQGVVQNPDKVSNKTAKMYHLTAGEGVFVLREEEIKRIKINEKEKRFMVDFFDENDIHKYIVSPKNKKFLLYLTKANCPDISLYPNIAAHLIKYKKIMDARRETKKGSNKWFHLHWPRENKYFEGHKIVVPAMFDSVRAGYQEQSGYFGLSTNVITSKNPDYNLKFILAILNSTFANYWFHKHGKKRGVGVDIGVDKLRNFPIRKCALQEQKQFIEIVNKIIAITDSSDCSTSPEKQARVKDYEKQIDQLVYKLYGLSPEEIAVVEGK